MLVHFTLPQDKTGNSMGSDITKQREYRQSTTTFGLIVICASASLSRHGSSPRFGRALSSAARYVWYSSWLQVVVFLAKWTLMLAETLRAKAEQTDQNVKLFTLWNPNSRELNVTEHHPEQVAFARFLFYHQSNCALIEPLKNNCIDNAVVQTALFWFFSFSGNQPYCFNYF